MLVDVQMTGYSGKFADILVGVYRNQPDVIIREITSDSGTYVTLSGGAESTYTVTITTNVIHPIVTATVSGGRTTGNFTKLPSITYSN
jgi:hypothetical protein